MIRPYAQHRRALTHVETLGELMTSLTASTQRPDAWRADRLIVQTLNFILSHLEQPITVATIVEHLPTTRRTLERRFRRRLDRSVAETLRALRIARVQQLLTNTNWKVGRIAETCGFSSLNQLCKSFRKETAMTPRDYRRSALRSRRPQPVGAISARHVRPDDEQPNSWTPRVDVSSLDVVAI